MPIANDLLFYVKAAIAIVLVFGVCIALHEFGHFYVAKRAGVAVPVFSIGFGPKLVKWRRGGTEYSIRLLPLGGFVQMAGEAPQESWFPLGQQIAYELNESLEIVKLGDPKDLKCGYVGVLRRADLTDRMEMAIETAEGLRTFQVKPYAQVMMNARSSMPLVEKHEQVLGKPLLQRAAIILAGPVMNFLLAAFLFALVNAHFGVATTVIGQVEKGSPAQTAGLQAGDQILAVNGQRIRGWNDLLISVQGDKPAQGVSNPNPLQLLVARDGSNQTLTVQPKLQNGVPMLGIDTALSHNPIRATGSAFTMLYHDSALTLRGYKQLVAQHQFQDLTGPVGIADVITQQVHYGIWNVVMIAAVISVNLGLFNLIPIPALDGGRLLFMIIELVRGRKVDPQREGFVHFVGFAVLMLFAVVITYRDVTHLF